MRGVGDSRASPPSSLYFVTGLWYPWPHTSSFTCFHAHFQSDLSRLMLTVKRGEIFRSTVEITHPTLRSYMGLLSQSDEAHFEVQITTMAQDPATLRRVLTISQVCVYMCSCVCVGGLRMISCYSACLPAVCVPGGGMIPSPKPLNTWPLTCCCDQCSWT